jgi:CBS domain containing-hemolysin-like protein
MIIELVLLVILIFLSAIFSSSELAVFSLSDAKIHHFVEKKLRNAGLLQRLKKDSHKLLITILIGNNIVNIASASIATALSFKFFSGNSAIAIATGAMTLIILTFGEIIPKAFATRKAKSIALFMAPVIQFLMIIFYPLVLLFDFLTSSVVSDDDELELVTEDEVRDIVKMSEEQGEIKEQEEEMIQNIFKLDDTFAEDAMTPRPDIYSFEADKTVGEVRLLIKESGFSRVPVYEGDLDNTVGVIYAKDLLGLDDGVGLKTIMRPVFFVPETKKVDSLLRDFKAKKIHIAMVVNEHGTVVGLITIEDLLEEIVGEIYDEMDSPTDGVEGLLKKGDRGELFVRGKIELDELEKLLDVHFDDGLENNTLSGLFMEKLNRVPEEDEELVLHGFSFVVRKMNQNRIEEVEIKKID